MKNLLKIVSIIGLTVITQTAYSAEITEIFETGDTLTAEKINNIKSAVNDNDKRISDIVLTPGQAGAPGAVGSIGDTGAKGETGAAGGIGDTGAKGDTGTSCTVAQGTGSATISCGSGTIASVYDGTTATGNAQGDMQFFDGGGWVLVPAPAENAASLSFCNGVPTWTQGACPDITITYAEGDTGPAGGIVFYVTDGGLHGLEAAAVDQVSTQWGCYGTSISGANGTVVGTGEQNTADIIEFCNETTAASVASAYGPGWYLPSKDELNLLYAQKVDGVVGGFVSGHYWSSSQDSRHDAWLQYGDYGYQNYFGKDYALGVRAVRAF
jgi:hypothetical protein